jgi:hypothetical protein
MIKIQRRILVPFFIAIIFIFVSCSEQKPQWYGTIDVVDGLTVVNNPKEPMYSSDVFNLEVDLTIGNEEVEEEFMFQEIQNMVVDEEENIYVLDTKALKIKVFGRNGDFLRIFGNKGQGPGELQNPFDMQILPHKEIMVYDYGLRQFNIFSQKGAFLRQFSTRQLPRFRYPKVDSRGNIVAGFWIRGDKNKAGLKKFDTELRPIFMITSQPLVSKSGRNFDYFEQLWQTNLAWNISTKDEIIWGVVTSYEVFVHNPEGKLIKKIIREYDGITITKKEEEKLIKSWFGDEPVPSFLTINFPAKYPSFSEFTCDEEGRIFVQTHEKTQDGERDYYDVFDSEGKYIARISLKYRPVAWKKNKLYTIEENEDGFPVVKRYKVTWNI